MHSDSLSSPARWVVIVYSKFLICPFSSRVLFVSSGSVDCGVKWSLLASSVVLLVKPPTGLRGGGGGGGGPGGGERAVTWGRRPYGEVSGDHKRRVTY